MKTHAVAAGLAIALLTESHAKNGGKTEFHHYSVGEKTVQLGLDRKRLSLRELKPKDGGAFSTMRLDGGDSVQILGRYYHAFRLRLDGPVLVQMSRPDRQLVAGFVFSSGMAGSDSSFRELVVDREILSAFPFAKLGDRVAGMVVGRDSASRNRELYAYFCMPDKADVEFKVSVLKLE